MSAELMVMLFVTSMFLGVELIRKVPGNLHTPLMSGSNAISGISLVGGVFAIGEAASSGSNLGLVLAGVATGLAGVNVVGGYLVTDRMLTMLGGGGGGGGSGAKKGGAGSGAGSGSGSGSGGRP